MDVKLNAIANYAGQLYSLLISVVALPLFLKIMGASAYGLVGFYTLVFAWLVIFDLGMTPALSREVARLKSRSSNEVALKSTVLTFEKLFWSTSLLVGAGLFFASDWLATNWLVIDNLDVERVILSLELTAIAVALRWQASIYRSVINGFEAQVWLNGADFFINSLRFPVLLLLMWFFPERYEFFFAHQAMVSLLEIIVLRRKQSALITNASEAPGFDWRLLRPLLPFAFSAAYASLLGVVIVQFDKLILSTILPLAEYGYFSLVGVAAGGVLTLSGPISKAVLPRLTALYAENRLEEMVSLYKLATFWMVITLAPLVLVLVMFPFETIFAWSGDLVAASWVAPILPAFVGVAGLTAVTVFQYFLQYAAGDLSLNVRLNSLLVVLMVPLITYAASQHGVKGVAIVAVFLRVLVFLFWVPFVHSRMIPNHHSSWLLGSIIKPMIVPALAITAVSFAVVYTEFSTQASRESATMVVLISLTVGYGFTGLWLWTSGNLRKLNSGFVKGDVAA